MKITLKCVSNREGCRHICLPVTSLTHFRLRAIYKGSYSTSFIDKIRREKKKREKIKTEKDVICHRDLADAGPGVPGRVNLRHRVFLSGDSRAQVVFTAIRPNIYLCFVVYEPKIHPSVLCTSS